MAWIGLGTARRVMLRGVWRSRRAVLLIFVVLASVSAHATALATVPGLTFRGCVGQYGDCAVPNPAAAIDGAQAVELAPNGRDLYVAGVKSAAISHFVISSAGTPLFVSCVGEPAGCAPSPPNVLDTVQAIAISSTGGDIYTVGFPGGAFDTGAVNHLKVDGSGNLTFAGCVGTPPACAATSPRDALVGLHGLALASGGKRLYVAGSQSSEGAISRLDIGVDGAPSFAGCTGSRAGCAPVTPPGVLDEVVDVGASGTNLYAAGGGAHSVVHMRIDDSTGALTVADCLGPRSGCGATEPHDALGFPVQLTLAPGGRNLYVSAFSEALSHLTTDSTGKLAFAGCVGHLKGCAHVDPLGAPIDSALGPDQSRLYAADIQGRLVDFSLSSSGDPRYLGCATDRNFYGQTRGCAPTPSFELDGLHSITTSADGQHLYAVSHDYGVLSDFTTFKNVAPNAFRLGKPVLNPPHGTATIPVEVYGPISLVLDGPRVRRKHLSTSRARHVRLEVELRKDARRELKRKHVLTVAISVRCKAASGPWRVKRRTVTLKWNGV